jgi:hypothetical protein
VTASTTRSAYPVSVDDLVPQVREWAEELGQTPSRNQIKNRFRVGAPKATKVLEALAAFDADRATTAQSRALHSVPDLLDPATPDPVPAAVPEREPVADTADVAVTDTLVTPVVDPGTDAAPQPSAPAGHPVAEPTSPAEPAAPAVAATVTSGPGRVRRWPLILLALPAFVAIWGGWVGLGRMTGFGPIQLLPGIWDELVVNSAITLPIGVEVYAAYAMSVWLSGRALSDQTRRFAKWSALGSLGLGMAGQVAYHLMSAAGVTVAPWLITTFVACLPVVVLGCGAALAHLMHEEGRR